MVERSDPSTVEVADEDASSSNTRSFGLRSALIGLLAVALLPAGGLAIAKAINTVREAQALRDSALVAQFKSFVDDEEALFVFARNLLVYARDDLADRLETAEKCNGLADRLVQSDPRFHAAHFTSADGYIRCGSNGFSSPIYVGDRGNFSDGRMLPEPSARVLFGRSSKIPVLVISEPVFDKSGALLGALSISISIGAVDALTKSGDENSVARIALAPTGGGGTPIAQDRGADAWLPSAAWAERASTTPYIWEGETAEGEPYVYVAGAVAGGGLTALAGWPSQQLSSVLRAETALSLALPLFTWLFASLIIYFAIERLVIRNLDQLTGMTQKLCAGDLNARVQLQEGAPLEFVQIGSDFDAMAEEIGERDAKLRRAVNEQKLLLREVYHRVKNNLQLIVSLINLQVRDAENVEESRLLRQTQDRVQSLALVHQSLYQIGSLSEARLDTILEQIVDALISVRDLGQEARGRITLDLDPVPLDADRAVPSALLATEGLLNAFKHARFGDSEARVEISLRAVGEGGYDLEIVNDAPAAGEADEVWAPPSGKKLGARLMQGFARQLRATLTQKVENGRFRMAVIAPAPALEEESRGAD